MEVRVHPGARRSEIQGELGGLLRVRVASPAVEGRANEALLRFLAESLHVARSKVELTRGETSRRKTVLVRGLSPREVYRSLMPEVGVAHRG